MKKNIVILILSLLLVVSLCYIGYDKILNEKDDCINENGNSSDVDSSVNDNENSNLNDKLDNDLSLGYDMSKIDKYMSVDGSYGTIKNIMYGNKFSNYYHYVNLDLSGNVIYEVLDGREYVLNEILSTKGIDILSCGDGEFRQACFFVLDGNGDIFKYTIDSLVKHEIPSKEKVLSNATKMFMINFCPVENAGCSVRYVGITKTGEIVELSGFAV